MAEKLLRGVPASVIDTVVFLAGVPVDPETITYEFKDPSPATALDEDALAVVGRVPIKSATGRYHAGNTVLPLDAPVGTTWEVIWSIKKTPASPIITRTVVFEVSAEQSLDPVQQETSRRDILDTPNIDGLRARIKDRAPDDTTWAFFNSELQRWLDDAFAMHTEGARTEATATADDVAFAMLLAHADAMHACASDKSRFFRWRDSDEEVDKSMVPRSCLEIAKGLLDKYNKLRKARRDDKALGIAKGRAGDRMEFRAR